MINLLNIFHKNKEKALLTKNELAALLKTDVHALAAFEKAYQKEVLNADVFPEDFFETNAKQAGTLFENREELSDDMMKICSNIVDELLEGTKIFTYNNRKQESFQLSLTKNTPVSMEQLKTFPQHLRPQLTGTMMQRDINEDASLVVLSYYKKFLNEKDPRKRKSAYEHFRQGLDILDLDPILYEIIGTNKNSIGYWLPPLAEAVSKQDFFQIPDTTVVKVPLSLLQLTRLPYQSLTPATLFIVDEFCKRAFNLNEQKEYFIKTGTYSSKFDFRNAYVHGEKEVKELGQYLLYIHFQALQMASPLCTPSIYGVSTTNEWCVREFIPDLDIPKNPCIYKGLPLRTEYRVFVDFDTDQIIGISPYWEPNTMKKRFAHEEDASSPHQVHDYVIYKAHEDTLMGRYNKNKCTVMEHLEDLIKTVNLNGQWSIDIMENGGTFHIIDMALANNSALVECVPKHLLKPLEEDWIPKLAADH